jgi:hypothetical protein
MLRYLALLLGASCVLGSVTPALGASIGSESSVGLAADYSSNPFLDEVGGEPAEAVAALLNVPITYNDGEQTIDLIPRLRFAETRGDAELLTNYEYLDADWRLQSERNTFSATADWHHDSTLYNVFEDGALAGKTVTRLEEIGSLAWQHQLTERSDFQINGSYDGVHYGAAADGALISYDYAQGALQYNRQLTERWQWQTSAGYGRYDVPAEQYHSQQEFIQTGLTRALSEQWSAGAKLGYAWLQDRSVVPTLYCAVPLLYCYFGISQYQIIDVTTHSSTAAPNGVLSLEHRDERLTLDVNASRAIVPSGFGELVTQTNISLGGNYRASERWTLGATLHGATLSDALQHVALGNQRYAGLDLSAAWQWTEHWTLQLTGAPLVARINGVQAHSVACSIGMFRQFGRVRLD